VALAASAGGLNALGSVLGGLPAEFSVPVVAVEHLQPDHASYLPKLLDRRTALSVRPAADGERLEAGRVYVAPPDVHTVVEGDVIHLEDTPPVRFLRPSIDRLFHSIAESYGAGALVVVLTGTGTDGAAGARAVKDAGGVVLVQDEGTSEHFGMPRAAIAAGAVDQVLPLEEIPDAILGIMVAGDAR
jgi:two-component system, chemotaxis family, protein-glutamate methylesterase/glutaminase